MARKQTKQKKTKRVSADPLINHVKRAVKKVTSSRKARGAVQLAKMVTPGVGARSLINKVTEALKKVNRSK